MLGAGGERLSVLRKEFSSLLSISVGWLGGLTDPLEPGLALLLLDRGALLLVDSLTLLLVHRPALVLILSLADLFVAGLHHLMESH